MTMGVVLLAGVPTLAITHATVDYEEYRALETPGSVMLSVYDGVDSRGFAWQTTNTVATGDVQLLKGVYGAADAALFETSGRVLPGRLPVSKPLESGINRHVAEVTGLERGATYSYRIGDAHGWVYGQFTVRPTDRAATTIVNLTDGQTSDATRYHVFENTCAVAAKTAGDELDFVLGCGDFHDRTLKNAGPNNAGGSRYSMSWALAVETTAPHFPGVPWVHASGNHDYYGFRANVAERFAVTNGTTYVGCHSFDCGNVHVATLPWMGDKEWGVGHEAALAWLDADLRATRRSGSQVRWRVVAVHGGPYTTGDQGRNGVTFDEGAYLSNMVVRLCPVLSSNCVDLVLQGHDHTYSKTRPYRWKAQGYTHSETDDTTVNITPETRLIDGIAYDVNPKGTYYVCSGCAGHRVGDNSVYASRTGAKSYTNRFFKVVTGRVGVTSRLSQAGEDASNDPKSGATPRFGILRAEGDRLTYDFYLANADETAELYDRLAILKTEPEDVEDGPEEPPTEPPDNPDDPPTDPEDNPEDPPTEPTDNPDDPPADPEDDPEDPPTTDPVIPDKAVTNVEGLVAAIDAAAVGDKIYIAPGVYNLTGVQMAQSGQNAQESHLNITKRLELIGCGAKSAATVLKGDGTAHRIAFVNTSDGAAFSNLTFTCGAPKSGDGGGVNIEKGATATTFDNCRFVDCRAADGGAGGAIFGKTLGSVARHCEFTGNRVMGAKPTGGGGTFRCDTVECVFTGNVTEGKGGGAYDGFHRGSVFTANLSCPTNGPSANGGGGLALGAAVGCLFVCNSNDVKNSHGGAIYQTTALTNCIFRKNFSASNGIIQQTPSVVGCTFEENKGQAVVRYAKASGTVANCLFVRNDMTGGTMVKETDAAYSVAICNCTFVGNTCKNGTLESLVSAVNCAFSENAPYDVYSSTYPDMTNCLYVTRYGKTELTKAVDCDQVADMKFKDPANGDYSPASAKSPLYDAGYESEDYLALIGECDCAQRCRRMHGHVDIGAFERQDPGTLIILK